MATRLTTALSTWPRVDLIPPDNTSSLSTELQIGGTSTAWTLSPSGYSAELAAALKARIPWLVRRLLPRSPIPHRSR